MHSSIPPRAFTLEPGFRLDRYELLCILAQGGMANVWLARLQGKHGFEKLFAIKTILPVHASDPSFRQMFLDEGRIASGIEHPNVVQILDLGEQHGTLYLVMEIVDGDPLQKLHRACEKAGKRIPIGIALRIVADACAGLDAAHNLTSAEGLPLNVVHRDVSPQNILVNTRGISKVIDFGIAKARDRETQETAAGTFKGKIQYMPHEQATGKAVDRRSDVWSAGAVLYYLLAGRPPYREETQFGTLSALMNGAPIPPLPAEVPAAVSRVVMKALATDRSERFQTAAELGAAIEDAMWSTDLGTTHAQVASFVETNLMGRAERRKKAIEIALKEASSRARALRALTAPPDSKTGLTHTAAVDGPDSAISSVSNVSNVSSVSSNQDPRNLWQGATPGGSGALPSNGTLGSSASALDVPRKRSPVPMTAGGLAIAAIVGLALFFGLRHPAPEPVAAAGAVSASSDSVRPVAPQDQDPNAAPAANEVVDAGRIVAIAPVPPRVVGPKKPWTAGPARPAKPKKNEDDIGF